MADSLSEILQEDLIVSLNFQGVSLSYFASEKNLFCFGIQEESEGFWSLIELELLGSLICSLIELELIGSLICSPIKR